MKVQTNQETVDEIKKVISENPGMGDCIRIYVAGIGWSGPSFGIALDEQKDTDEFYEEFGQGFVMEKDFYAQFGDFIIEYSPTGYIVAPVQQQAVDCGGCTACG